MLAWIIHFISLYWRHSLLKCLHCLPTVRGHSVRFVGNKKVKCNLCLKLSYGNALILLANQSLLIAQPVQGAFLCKAESMGDTLGWIMCCCLGVRAQCYLV